MRGCGLAILRVVVGFPPGTSPLACPCLYGGGISEVFPVLRGGVVARATCVFFGDVDVFAGEPSGDPGEEW